MLLPRWLIKLGFHLLYYQLAWTYDLVAWTVSFGQWAEWRRLALEFLQPGPVLELAYGTGGFLVDLLEAGYKPVGLDLSPYMARLAASRLRQRGFALQLSQARAQAIPFPSDYFANVVATFPTNYMLQQETLTEVYRVLRDASYEKNTPAGRLVIVMEGQLRGNWPLRPIIDWLYKITGQRSDSQSGPVVVMSTHHLAARWQTVERRGALAHLLIAEKCNQMETGHNQAE